MADDNIGCTRKDGTYKRGYKKRQDANRDIQGAKLLKGTKLKPYRCPTCGWFHLTSQSAKQRRGFKAHGIC